MANTDFIKQDSTNPAFPELLWSKPEQIAGRGRLLIIGGNAHGLTAPLKAYEYATEAGAGHARVLLPASLKQFAGKILEHGEYAPYTPSGSFSKKALDTALDNAAWAHAVLLAGDIGRNSETSMMFGSFLRAFKGSVVLTKDGVDAVLSEIKEFVNRENTILVLSFSQLQKIVQKLAPDVAVTLSSPIQAIADVLSVITKEKGLTIVTVAPEVLYVSSNGLVSVTKIETNSELWALRSASFISVWAAQQPEKLFESVTTAVYESLQSTSS